MSKKVIIIGAGASGIAAATKLYQHGFKSVTILEAENRIGGRIHTIPFASNVVDLGAQWCHGEEDNCVHELAKEYDLFASASKRRVTKYYYRYNGEKLDTDVSTKLDVVGNLITDESEEELKNYNGSLGDFVLERFKTACSEDETLKNISPSIIDEYLNSLQKQVNALDASSTWYDLSAEGYTHFKYCEGDFSLGWKDLGYKTILDILLQRYPNAENEIPVDIQLNKTVCKIEWTEKDSEKIRVHCEDNTMYEADHVIVTVSLGVLKYRFLELFVPSLPEANVRAIEGLSIGTVNKIYMEFSERTWPEDFLGGFLLFSADDVDNIRNQNEWLSDVLGIFTVDYQPNILCGWISGEKAMLMEKSSNDEIKRGMMFLVKKFFANLTFTDPIRVQNTTWNSNSNFRGSYSYRSIKTDELKTGSDALALPIKNSVGMPVVQFGGEATHDHYYSTVHGAIESGWREAKRIIDFHAK